MSCNTLRFARSESLLLVVLAPLTVCQCKIIATSLALVRGSDCPEGGGKNPYDRCRRSCSRYVLRAAFPGKDIRVTPMSHTLPRRRPT